MNNGSVDIKRGGTGGRDQGMGRSGCKVEQGVDEVDAAGELISVIWTSISSAVKRVLTFGVQMQAKKHRVHEISTFLPTLPAPDPPIRFRRVYADPQYATHAYWRRRDTISCVGRRK
jgi:hypothetical protein